MNDNPETGARATCEQCSNDIIFVGPYWEHMGMIQPRHPAMPQKADPKTGLLPAKQRAMDALLAAWEAFRSIPESVPATDIQKFRDAIHDGQYVLASLAMHRLYPDYWR